MQCKGHATCEYVARDGVPRTQWPDCRFCGILFYLWAEKSRFDIESVTISMHILHEHIFHSVAVMRTVCECAQFHYSLL